MKQQKPPTQLIFTKYNNKKPPVYEVNPIGLTLIPGGFSHNG